MNRWPPWRFVFAFGGASMLADLVYESARAITGPYLGLWVPAPRWLGW